METKVQMLRFGKGEYVVLPKAEYLRLRKGEAPPGTVDALAYADEAIAQGLRQAREAGGLTQVELAAKLGKSQGMVSGAEGGRVRVGERYIASVLKACGLPKDWKAPKATKSKTKSLA